jgi:hypothetical protein
VFLEWLLMLLLDFQQFMAYQFGISKEFN